MTPDDSTSSPLTSAWTLSDPEPTTLMALWPHDQAPTRTEILAAMANQIGRPVSVVDEMETEEDDGVLWNAVMELPIVDGDNGGGDDARNPVAIIWAQPAAPARAEEVGEAGAACRWVVGLETMLNMEDALSSFIAWMRLLASALSDAPAILDVNSTTWHRRRELDDVFLSDEVEPAADVLWVIHAVTPDDEAADDSGVWLHTHGLWRCGLPELDLVEVPVRWTNAAAELINRAGALLLELPVPEPGALMAIGSGLPVTFQPWQQATKHLRASQPGSFGDREGEYGAAHGGVRAVICDGAARPSGSAPQPPHDVLEQLAGDNAVVYVTQRETARQARMARATWPELATAFAALGPQAGTSADDMSDDSAVFLLKAGFDASVEAMSDREHLWFIVRSFTGDVAETELVNEPVHVQTMARGDVVSVERERISGWQMMSRYGMLGPDDVGRLWEVVDRLRAGGGGA